MQLTQQALTISVIQLVLYQFAVLCCDIVVKPTVLPSYNLHIVHPIWVSFFVSLLPPHKNFLVPAPRFRRMVISWRCFTTYSPATPQAQFYGWDDYFAYHKEWAVQLEKFPTRCCCVTLNCYYNKKFLFIFVAICICTEATVVQPNEAIL